MTEPNQIRCAEIFGGNTLTDIDVCTRGLTASVFSAASEGDRGGDVYYVSVCSSNLLTRIAVLDMRGHGSEVSHLSEWLYRSLEHHMNTPDGAGILSDLNAQVHARGFEALTTAAILSYYIGDSRLYFSYAGHPPALLRAGRSGWEPLALEDTTTPANLPLGVMRAVQYDQQSIVVQPGDRFVIYTDGVLECANRDGCLFGDERLNSVLTANVDESVTDLKQAVSSELRAWAGGALSHDDCTLMAVEVSAAGALQ